MLRYLIFLLLTAGLSAQAQQVIEGLVVDKETGKPIPFASIGVVGTAKGTSTNLNGQFSLVVNDRVTISVTCVGYESVSVIAPEKNQLIQLAPKSTELNDVVVFSKKVNPGKMVIKALAMTDDNFPTHSFFQTFFYRHYCQDDDRYGRLIEAYVDVWRQNGYREFRHAAGEREALRVSQLRRSLDRTAVSQSHEPIGVANILLADIAAYQTPEEYARLDFHAGLNNLRMDIEDYDFTFGGITSYDGEEVFEINFNYPAKGQQNSAVGPGQAGLTGNLFITTDRHAIVRFEEMRYKGNDTIRTSAFYRKYNDNYFPYHLVRDGGTSLAGKRIHWFHIEMMSVEISDDPAKRFEGKLPDKEGLLAIAYDSTYWRQRSVLTATPLEREIIRDLGGGKSLDQQFRLYQEYESNTTNGGVKGEEKLQWLIDFLKGQKPLVVCYWQGDYGNYMSELEQFRQLNKKFRDQATFAMISLDPDQKRWQETILKYNLPVDGMLQYRLGSISQAFERLPFYRITNRAGDLVELTNRADRSIEQAVEAALKDRGNQSH